MPARFEGSSQIKETRRKSAYEDVIEQVHREKSGKSGNKKMLIWHRWDLLQEPKTAANLSLLN